MATLRTQTYMEKRGWKDTASDAGCSPGKKNCARKKAAPKDGFKKIHVSSEKACDYRQPSRCNRASLIGNPPP